MCSPFLPYACWFSANKGAVSMQDKNILTDLSSSVSNIWFQLETNYESSEWAVPQHINLYTAWGFGFYLCTLHLLYQNCFGSSSSLKTLPKFFPPPWWMTKAVHSPFSGLPLLVRFWHKNPSIFNWKGSIKVTKFSKQYAVCTAMELRMLLLKIFKSWLTCPGPCKSYPNNP